MPYEFQFDLSGLPKAFFRKLVTASYKKSLHKRAGKRARELIKEFRLSETTGLELSDAVKVVEDLIDANMRNVSQRSEFLETNKRALFLPHCSRKYMDKRCEARFDPEVPSYYCNHCSPDCLINQATTLGEERGYDVYILPGGSCVPKILKENSYEGVVGVACGKELLLGAECLEEANVPGQEVFLTKNGCSNTKFSIESLKRIL